MSFPGGVPAGFRQSREEAQAIVMRKFRDLPFPDWRRRADVMRLAEPLRRFRKYRYRLAALFSKGKERERARCRVFEMARRQWGYDAMAEFASDFHINFIRRPRRREVPRE